MRRLSYICTICFDTGDLMKPRGSIRVVKMWHGICTDPLLRCFDNPEGLSCGNLVVSMVPVLSSWLTV
jgi:hypothetical protein